MPKFSKHFREFQNTIELAAKAWYHAAYLNKAAASNDRLFEKLRETSSFWMVHRKSAEHLTIILLGQIFDTDSRSYSLCKLLTVARSEFEHFSHSELRKRKQALMTDRETIESFVTEAHEFKEEDLNYIEQQVEVAKVKWNDLSELRNRFFAHNDVLSDDARDEILESASCAKIEKLLDDLLTISSVLEEAEQNGTKPEFTARKPVLVRRAEKDVEALVKSLFATPSSN